MNNFLIRSLLLLLVLGFISFFLRPDLSKIDFLTLSITIFSISMAMVAFMSPLLHKFRGILFDLDRALIDNHKVRINGCIALINSYIDILNNPIFKENDADSNKKKLLSEKTKLEKELSKLEKHPEFHYELSSIVTNIFYSTKKRIKWCLLMIFLMFLFNSVLFNSQVFLNFICDNCNFISNLHRWKDDISTFINISTLTCQLYLLYRLIIDSMDLFIRVNTNQESNN